MLHDRRQEHGAALVRTKKSMFTRVQQTFQTQQNTQLLYTSVYTYE